MTRRNDTTPHTKTQRTPLRPHTEEGRSSAVWSRAARTGATITTVLAMLGATAAAPAAAAPMPSAPDTVYEIEASWADGTPSPVSQGNDLTAIWRYNINDANPAPGNPPQDNVTLRMTVQGAVFTELPAQCLVDGVDPASSLAADGLSLVCNVGTRDHGSAELVVAGVRVTGATGDIVSVSGSVGGADGPQATAEVPELAVLNPFRMDMKFDAGQPRSNQDGTRQILTFPWSLRAAPGADAGPNTVSYNLNLSTTAGGTLTPATGTHLPCSANDLRNPGHPYSAPDFDSERTAPFVGSCTLTVVSTNVLRLTLTGIDYSRTVLPTHDTNGVALATDWDVVAAGLLRVQFTYSAATTTTLTASTPTYTSVNGETFTDIGSNNSSSIASTRGTWTGSWSLGNMRPAVQGSAWTDTFRSMPGERVLATSGVLPPVGTTGASVVCTILDSRYVSFEEARLGTIDEGVVTPTPGITYEYYTLGGNGGIVNPASNAYDPNAFRCDGTTGATWQSTLPADLSTVKAIRATIPASTPPPSGNLYYLYTYSRIRDDVAVGQDIWTWTGYRVGSGGTWQHPRRTLNPADVPGSGTLTPGARYPYAAGGRDVLRTVAGTPILTKEVDSTTVTPGGTANFTLHYRIEAPANTTVDGLTIVDTLPAGLTYVPGSASVTPASVSGQQITWNFSNVQTNTDYAIQLSALVDQNGQPLTEYQNSATASLYGVTSTDTATVRIRDGGYTSLTKTADAQRVPHATGTAEGGWTVRLRSYDSSDQALTDTIDVLPYNGDGRGTSFTGEYALSGPVDTVAGAVVYYTTTDPATLNEDPSAAANGQAGNPAGNSVGWTTTFTPEATAVRVIGPSLDPGATQEFHIGITTEGATYEDIYVNRAHARAERTALVMRTSGWFEIAAVNSVAIKKFVQDLDGEWHDAQDSDDYPSFHNGQSPVYRLVVTNTGDEPLVNLAIEDDRIDLAAIDPLPAGLAPGAVIPELLPGEENAITIEYTVELAGFAPGDQVVNNACVVPEDAEVDGSCDPAGVIILPSSLAWEKISAGPQGERLEGSEWELVLVDADQNPVGSPIAITDCIEDAAADCTDADLDPTAGGFLVGGLADGTYRLVETRAPAGYVLDEEPRFITVQGITEFADPIVNEQVPELVIPLTGGIGRDIFLAGAVFAAAGGLIIALIRRSRRRIATVSDAT